MLQLRTLGCLDLKDLAGHEADREALQPKRLALLVYLALDSHGGFHRRDSLVALLWPDLDQPHARAALRKAIHHLRLLASDLIITRGNDDVRLDPAAIRCDASELLRSESGLPQDALELYQGEFLPGFHVPDAPDFEEWIEQARTRLRASAGACAIRLAEGRRAQKQIPEAIRYSRRAVEILPLQERPTRLLIELLEESGDLPDALVEYERFAERLEGELEVAPTAEMRELALRLLEKLSGPVAHSPVETAQLNGVETNEGNDNRLRLGVRRPPGAVTAADPRPEALTNPVFTTRTARTVSQRQRRKVWLVLGVTSIVAVVIAAGSVFRAKPSGYHPNRVLVVPFENRTGDPSLDHLSLMVSDWVSGRLLDTGLEVIPTTTIMSVTRTLTAQVPMREAGVTPQRIAKETGAGLIVSGAYYLTGDSVRFEGGLQQAGSDRLLTALDPVRGTRHDPMSAVTTLGERVRAALAPHADPRLRRFVGVIEYPPSYDAYQLVVQAWEAFWRDQVEARTLLSRAVALDTTYAYARLFLAVTDLNLGDLASADSGARILERDPSRLSRLGRTRLSWLRAKLDGDHQAAYRAQQETNSIAPADVGITQMGLEAINPNRPREALVTLSRIDPHGTQLQGYWHYWTFVCAAHHMLGDHEAELQAARSARKQYPRLVSSLRLEVVALAALGRVAETERALNQSVDLESQFGNNPGSVARAAGLEFRVHGDSASASRALQRSIVWYRALPLEELQKQAFGFAEALYALGRWEEAATVLESAKISADGCLGLANAVACEGLGIAIVARRGQRAQAVLLSDQFGAVDRRPLALEGVEAFWRARIAAVLGDQEGAVALLRQAQARGTMHGHGIWYGDGLHRDPDLGVLRGYPPFDELVRPKS